MARFITMDACVDLAYGAGFRGESLAVAVAIAKAESSLDVDNVGDVGKAGQKTADGRHWGVSYGLWQIRTIVEALGSGADRDRRALADPGRQARAAYNISKGGTDWRPWSTFTERIHSRYIAEARAAASTRVARGGSGSTASAPAAAPPLAERAERSPDVILPVAALPTAYVAPGLPVGLMLHTPAGIEGLGEVVLGGEVDLTLEETSELRVRLVNTARLLFGRAQGIGEVGARLQWGDLDLRVAAHEMSPTRSGSEFTLIARERAIQELKRKPSAPTAAVTQNISPTEYAASLAARASLRFVGEGSARLPSIAAQEDESQWALLQRLAIELGFICFVSAGVLYFGRPSWIVDRTTGVKVAAFSPELGGAFVGWWGNRDTDTIEMPHYRSSEDAEGAGRTLSFRLPRWRGELVRPGMRVELAGLEGVPSKWLVTRVGWPIDNGISPVEVECIEPVDTPVLDPLKTGVTAIADGAGAGATQRSTGTGGWRWPTYGTVSSEFGVPRGGRKHAGIDIAASRGRPIRAARAGKVTVAKFSSSAGNFVVVDHGDGYSTRYLHMHAIGCRVGQHVQQGAILGEVGSTGRSTGNHLHYEILKDGVAVNPRSLHTGDPTP